MATQETRKIKGKVFSLDTEKREVVFFGLSERYFISSAAENIHLSIKLMGERS